MITIILVVAAAVALVGLYGWYATIVARRNRVAEALSGIDVQLAQRHDLIPNLLAIAKRFMAHEQDLLEEITALRTKAAGAVGVSDPAAVGAKFATEEKLGTDMARLFAVAENYPQLKSDGPMIEAQRGYSEVETNIAAARRFYNSAVGDLRNAVQTFPGPLLAGMAGTGTLPPSSRQMPKAVRRSMPQNSSEALLAALAPRTTGIDRFTIGALAALILGLAIAGGLHTGHLGSELFWGSISAIGFWIAANRILGWIVAARTKVQVEATVPPFEEDPALAPVLAKLETTRLQTAADIDRRVHRMLPLGFAVGILLWGWDQFGSDPSGPVILGVQCAIGGAFAYVWAAAVLAGQI